MPSSRMITGIVLGSPLSRSFSVCLPDAQTGLEHSASASLSASRILHLYELVVDALSKSFQHLKLSSSDVSLYWVVNPSGITGRDPKSLPSAVKEAILSGELVLHDPSSVCRWIVSVPLDNHIEPLATLIPPTGVPATGVHLLAVVSGNPDVPHFQLKRPYTIDQNPLPPQYDETDAQSGIEVALNVPQAGALFADSFQKPTVILNDSNGNCSSNYSAAEDSAEFLVARDTLYSIAPSDGTSQQQQQQQPQQETHGVSPTESMYPAVAATNDAKLGPKSSSFFQKVT